MKKAQPLQPKRGSFKKSAPAADANRSARNGEDGTSAPLRRAAQIIDVVSASDDGLPLHKITSSVGLPASTTHRLVRSLMGIDYIAYNERERTYALGRRLIHVMHAALGTKNIQSLAEPILRRLVRQFGQVFYINQLAADRARVVAFVIPDSTERARVVPGEYSPIHAAAGGKAIFAFQDDASIERHLSQPLKKYTAQTITDPAAVRRDLARVRKEGYAETHSEFDTGVMAVAVPVDIPDAGVIYSIGVAGFEPQMLEHHPIKTYVGALRAAATDFSSALRAIKRGGSRQ